MSLNPLQELIRLVTRGMAREIVAQAKKASVKAKNLSPSDSQPDPKAETFPSPQVQP